MSRAEGNVRTRVWKVWGTAVAALILLDVTFNWYFWKIPRVSQSRDRVYEFLMETQVLHRPKPAGTRRVVVFGSSVAHSFDPHQVETLLESARPSHPVEIHRLLKPAMRPSDHEIFFTAEGNRIHPDVVVYIFNVVDFLKPEPDNGIRPAVHDVLPPWTTLVMRHHDIRSLNDRLELLAAAASNLYRYRKPLRTSMYDHVKLAWKWLRSNSATDAYGFYPDGYTHHRFGFRVRPGMSDEFEYYIHPAWIEQRGIVRLRFSLDGEVIAEKVESEPGWHSVRLNVGDAAGRLLDVTADSTWSPRAAGLDNDIRMLGVRLRQPIAASTDGSAGPLRYPPTDPGYVRPFLRMGPLTGPDFDREWERQLNADTPFAAEFRAYRDKRLQVRDAPFEVRGEFAALQRLVAMLADAGAEVVLINAPESPLIAEYQSAPFYQAYLAFLRGLEQENKRVRFVDLRHALPREDFNDWHHPTYIGSIKLGRRYAAIVAEALGWTSARADSSQ